MIPGYQVVETLYESSRSLICRGRRTSDQAAVVLKQLKLDGAAGRSQAPPIATRIARFQLEYEITRRLQLAGVIRVYGLETHEHCLVMVEEDFGAESLAHYVAHHRLTLAEFLRLAIRLTEILAEVHQQQVLHRDINPANIVLNPASGQLKLIDFGIATVLSREDSGFCHPQLLEGTLAYLSPEQTGRMNRAVDYRSDFYSLGVTFYQLLSDRLPFEATDALELVHCHLAKPPLPLAQLHPQIPVAVSDIVMKLLAKNAEDRYQSAWGLRADLQTCLEQWQKQGAIAPFALAQQDRSEQFQLPQRLYGRAQERQTLLAACERIGRPSARSEIIWIRGCSGIGKSALVKEVYQPLTRQRGYFIAGKAALLQRDRPYFPFIQAFQELVRQILPESDAQIARWRQQLMAALGANAQVVADVIPEIELIIGKSPAVPSLSPLESQNRFKFVFQQFIRVFAQPDHPLVIFLDDLQWADRASLDLIRLIMAPESQSLLLIGAYRDHEVDAGHPLVATLDQLEQQGAIAHSIALAPLDLTAIHLLVADTLRSDPEQTQPLAVLIAEKTAGNPLFITELFKVLAQEQLIAFDATQGRWQWHLEQMQVFRLADTVVELVLDRLQQLPEPTQQLLTLAACIGNQFDGPLLAAIAQQSPAQVAQQLHEAVQLGLLFAVDADYGYSASDSPAAAWSGYKFSHDRIQQAAYSLIEAGDRPQIHLQIGRLLLQTTPAAEREPRIFEIVNQLNLGREGMAEAEKLELAQLNLRAGQKAKAAVAYESAWSYLAIGQQLLDAQSWNRHYELTLALYSALAEAAYLCGNVDQMEQLAAIVLEQARSPLDPLHIYEVKIQAYIAQNRLDEAIAVALAALHLLGVDIPPQPAASDRRRQANQTKLALADRPIQDLVDLPRMTDPHKLAAMRVIASVCTPAYFKRPDLWQLMVFQKVQLSIKYGNAPGSAFGYGDYGLVLCAVEGEIERGYQFGQLAAALLPQLQAQEFAPKTLLLINAYLRHWHEHLRTTLDPLRHAYESGLETGDLEYATFAIAFHAYHAVLVGEELTQLEAEMAEYGKAIAQFKQAIPLHLNQLYRQVVLNLLGQSAHPCELTGDSYREQAQLAIHRATGDRYALFHLHLAKLMLCYLFGDYGRAAEQATLVEQLLLQQATGLLVVPVFYFYRSLANLAVFDRVSAAEQAQILQRVERDQAKMQDWAAHAPMNYLHKYYLVQAERDRVLGEDWQAMQHYDRAIELAQQHHYPNEEAIAQERAADFYLARGKPKIAQVYLREARSCYLEWGAIAKARDLETRYPQLVEPPRPQPEAFATTTEAAASTLDLTTVLKAAQVLTREITLDRLLARLMQILIENAGAETGFLILNQQGSLVIAAAGTASSDPIQVLQSLPIASAAAADLLSTGIVNYVARTQESMVSADVSQDSRFAHDAYIAAHRPRSILCAPLINQTQLTGLVYLENRLTTNAFTGNHLELVQLLSAQAAVLIDNARLYNELDQRVQQRTAELVQLNHQLEQQVLERQRSEQTLRLIVEGTAAVTGKDFFHSLVRSLAKALDVPYAFITECDRATPMHLRAIACWYQQEFGENFEYDVHGTPCEQVISGQSYQCYPQQLQALFPADRSLVDMQAESYAGIPLLNSSGKLLGHLAVLADRPIADIARTTAVLEIFAARAAAELERQQAEEATRISQEKFLKAFRSSPSGITITTMNEDRFIEVNESFLRLVGYDRLEVIGQTALELGLWVSAEQRAAIGQWLQAQGTVSNAEVELRRKSGETFLALVAAEIIDLGDQPCVLAVITDITVLKQAAKALERLAEIGELASMIVHEVRNPLTTMLMGLNAFKRLELPGRFQEYLTLALDEGDRLQRLLNQILLYAKPQTLNCSEVNLNELLTETLNALQTAPAASGKQLQLTAALTAILFADRDKLKQVLINLVTNACEAVENRAVIAISLQKDTFNSIQIQIHNGGEPIPSDILVKLTQPFFTTKANGTGLGLAIVKRIVEAHAGELQIESSAATGTTVTVKLPLVTTLAT